MELTEINTDASLWAIKSKHNDQEEGILFLSVFCLMAVNPGPCQTKPKMQMESLFFVYQIFVNQEVFN